MILVMQIGFALMEAGSVRRKNSSVVFYRYIISNIVGILAFWVLGYAFAFGDAFNAFIGGHYYYAGDQWNECDSATNEITQYAFWCFQFAVGMISLQITLGIVSERITMKAAALYSFWHMFWVYPITVAWTWAKGWVTYQGSYDYGGASPVFLTGAWAGLAALLIVGRRYNRWNTFEDIYDERMMNVEMRGTRSVPVERVGGAGGAYVPVPSINQEGVLGSANPSMGNAGEPNGEHVAASGAPHNRQVSFVNMARIRDRAVQEENDNFGIGNLAYFGIGFLITFVGFFFYTAGMTWGMYKSGYQLWKGAEIAAANLIIAAMGGGLIGLVSRSGVMYGFRSPFRLRYAAVAAARGAIVGMVATLSAADLYEQWATVVIAFFAIVGYYVLAKFFEWRKMDDPIDGFSMFAAAGAVGLCSVAFLNHLTGIVYHNQSHGRMLGTQVLSATIIPAWAFLMSLAFWLLMKLVKWHRIDVRTEVVGYDYVEFADEIDFTGKKLITRKVEPAVGEKA